MPFVSQPHISALSLKTNNLPVAVKLMVEAGEEVKILATI